MKTSELIAAVIIVAFIIVVLISGIYPALRRAPQGQCLNNMKQMMSSVSLYVGDFGAKLPPADNWVDGIYGPYLSDFNVTICPEAKPDHEQIQNMRVPDKPILGVGYAMYGDLSSVQTGELYDPEHTPVLFDTSIFERNANGSLTAMAYRHLGRTANVAFVDGHCESLNSQPAGPEKLLCDPGEKPKPPSEEAKAREAKEQAEGHNH